MRSYKSKYDIPLFNWIMISENGFNLSYLKKNGKEVKKKEFKKLNEIYMTILDSLNDAKFETLEKYVDWQALITKYRAELLIKNGKNIIKEDYEVIVKDLEKVFRAYLEVLERDYKDFEFTEYYFNPDYKKLFIEYTKDNINKEAQEWILKDLHNFKDARFYDWNQYTLLCQMYPTSLILTLNPAFKKAFILERKIKIQSLINLDIMLNDIFSKNNMYDDYQFIRAKLFDLNRINSEKKKDVSGFEEVSGISQIIGVNIDSKRTTLVEFEAHKVTAKRVVENSKPKEA